MPDQATIDRDWLRMCEVKAKNRSKDPSRQVAACVVSPCERQQSFGYNGLPRGLEESEAHWARPIKYEFVVHAEINAIVNCPFDTQGATLYATFKPCHRCLGAIRNAGIHRVVWMHDPKPFSGHNEEAFGKIIALFGAWEVYTREEVWEGYPGQ